MQFSEVKIIFYTKSTNRKQLQIAENTKIVHDSTFSIAIESLSPITAIDNVAQHKRSFSIEMFLLGSYHVILHMTIN